MKRAFLSVLVVCSLCGLAVLAGCTGSSQYDGPVQTLDDLGVKIDGKISSEELKTLGGYDIAGEFKGSSGTPLKDIETGKPILEKFILKVVDADCDGKADDLYFLITESKDAVDAWAIKDNRQPAEFSIKNPNTGNTFDFLVLNPNEDKAYKLNDQSESAGGNYKIPDDRRYVIDSVISKDRTTTEGVCLDVVPVIESMGTPLRITSSGGQYIVESFQL